MKKFVLIILFFCISLSGAFYSNAQTINPKKEAKKEGLKRANKNIEKGIDKGFDSIEDGIGNFFKKKKKRKKKNTSEYNNDSRTQIDSEQKEPTNISSEMQWNKFDFVPGDKVIFDDLPSPDEENGEFPSHWDLVKGQVEIAEVDQENVVAFFDGNPAICPYIKNAEKDYLPEIFTIEFDIFRPANGNRFFLELYDKKNQTSEKKEKITIGHNYISINDIKSYYPTKQDAKTARWMHISLAFTKGKLKIYMDDTRLINIPHYSANPSGFTINCYFADSEKSKVWFLKNFRLAEGGIKYYDRLLQEGRIICNGIRFDVNKASLKPESMGSINEIFELMQSHPELKFSVEGHTDSDGDEQFNRALSEKRAKTVTEKLIDMGISSDRLTSKGLGEEHPIDNNTTSSGKANNRRVEFVRLNN